MPQDVISQFDRKYPAPLETYRLVADTNARDAIPSPIRWEGMLAYVRSENVTYILSGGVDNSNWSVFGGGIADAPQNNISYYRENGQWLPFDPQPVQFGFFIPQLQLISGSYTFNFRVEFQSTADFCTVAIELYDINTVGTPVGPLEISGLPFSVDFDCAMALGELSGSDEVFISMWARAESDTNTIRFASKKNPANTNWPGPMSDVTFTNGRILVSGTYKRG